ncbi:hypothetical protein C2G38_2170208 [Gigaspora rosea]|uniref:Uncharacterized protein n=1 Tax=Gigaspora rosea TaxID=44941 RepID=A0A397VRB3_9GLOM|nr:hypothetical protein C2G38_2170208 [Gigaspora rosea]
MKRSSPLGKDKKKNAAVLSVPKRNAANEGNIKASRKREVDFLWTKAIEEYIKSGFKPLCTDETVKAKKKKYISRKQKKEAVIQIGLFMAFANVLQISVFPTPALPSNNFNASDNLICSFCHKATPEDEITMTKNKKIACNNCFDPADPDQREKVFSELEPGKKESKEKTQQNNFSNTFTSDDKK